MNNKHRLGKPKSIEECLKISHANKGQIPWHTGTGVGPHSGKELSDVHRKNLSVSMLGKNTYPRSPEHRNKLSESQKGRPRSQESIAKQKAAIQAKKKENS